MAYSVRCPAFRTRNCAVAIACSEIVGSNQRSSGRMKREVWAAEPISVDAANIISIQARGGIHAETRLVCSVFNCAQLRVGDGQ